MIPKNENRKSAITAKSGEIMVLLLAQHTTKYKNVMGNKTQTIFYMGYIVPLKFYIDFLLLKTVSFSCLFFFKDGSLSSHKVTVQTPHEIVLSYDAYSVFFCTYNDLWVLETLCDPMYIKELGLSLSIRYV